MPRVIHLQIHNDNGTPTLLDLEPGTYVIGREPTCDIPLTSLGVSRKHASIVLSEEAIEIEDLGSRSGTWVGDLALKSPVTLPLPASISIGNIQIDLRSKLSNKAQPQELTN